MHYRNVIIWAATATYLLLTACANTQVASTTAIQQHSAKAAQAASQEAITPEQAISEAERQLLEARNTEIGFFAPLHLAQAEESIRQAKQYLSKPPKDIKNAALMSAIAAQTFISKGYENKKAVEGNLKQVLAHKKVLEQLNAPSELPEDFQNILSDLVNLIKLIESGKVAEAVSEQNTLLDAMAEVEINTLRKQHLTTASAYLEKAEGVDADDYAEISYENAEKTLEASDNFIQKNYRDLKGVKRAGLEALNASQQAYFVAIEAKKRVNMNPVESEKHVLDLVSMQNRLYQRGYDHDLAPQKIYDAQKALLEMVDDLKQQLQQSQAALAEQQRAIKVVQNTVDAKLKAEADQGAQITPVVEQNEDITVIKTLPEQTSLSAENAVSLQADEQPFDSVENMQVTE